jgi:glutaredoxin
MKCPKCGYVRKSEELAPEWQCPSCQVVYAKASIRNDISCDIPIANAGDAPTHTDNSATARVKTLITFVLIALLLYGGYSFSRMFTGDSVEASPIVAPENTVLLYSSASCGYCNQAKSFLKEHNINFEEYDIHTSERGRQDFEKLGGIGVPILIVADTKVVGFDEGGLKDVLKSKGLWK